MKIRKPWGYMEQPRASAHALILRNDKVLLVRRAHPPSQGKWSIPGGVIKLGETFVEAAQREVREECGVDIEAVDLLEVTDNVIRDDDRIRFHYILIYVLARYVGGQVRAQSDALDARWVGKEELDGLDMHPLARMAVEKAFKIAARTGHG